MVYGCLFMFMDLWSDSISCNLFHGHFCHGATEGIFVAIDLEAHVEGTGTPQAPGNVVQQTHLPVEEVLHIDGLRW